MATWIKESERKRQLIEMLLKEAGYKLEGKMYVNNDIKSAFGVLEIFPEESPLPVSEDVKAPSNIVEQLEEANPYTINEYSSLWKECVSKLRELIKQQPVQGNESFEIIAKKIAYSAWKSASNAYRMYPNNKHTFTDYWENYGGKNSLSSYPASQGNAEVLVKALDQIKNLAIVKSPHAGSVTSKRVLDIIKEALASYNTGKGEGQDDDELEDKIVNIMCESIEQDSDYSLRGTEEAARKIIKLFKNK